MKRIISMITVVAILLTLSLSAFAATDASMALVSSKATVLPGETFTVTLAITGDSNTEVGCKGGTVKMTYDHNSLTFNSAESAIGDIGLTGTQKFTDNGSGQITIQNLANAAADKAYLSGNLTFATMSFTVKETVAAGTVLTFAKAASGTKVAFAIFGSTASNVTTLTSATVTVASNTPSTPDDVVLSEETFEEGAKAIEEGATIKYGDKEVVAGANAKIYTFFSKAAKELLPETYGVTATIGGKTYKFPGAAKVSAEQNWAIQFIVPNGEFSDKVAIENITAVPYVD